mmetsp:Transcript_17184/g.35564  ORF Transcript_17184/g.35564 Transcript_17184/m.35564 type:complete len:97 (-) Transcript_17184:764-1054(-)
MQMEIYSLNRNIHHSSFINHYTAVRHSVSCISCVHAFIDLIAPYYHITHSARSYFQQPLPAPTGVASLTCNLSIAHVGGPSSTAQLVVVSSSFRLK